MQTHGGLTRRSQLWDHLMSACEVDEQLQNELAVRFHVSCSVLAVSSNSSLGIAMLTSCLLGIYMCDNDIKVWKWHESHSSTLWDGCELQFSSLKQSHGLCQLLSGVQLQRTWHWQHGSPGEIWNRATETEVAQAFVRGENKVMFWWDIFQYFEL